MVLMKVMLNRQLSRNGDLMISLRSPPYRSPSSERGVRAACDGDLLIIVMSAAANVKARSVTIILAVKMILFGCVHGSVRWV